MQSFRVIDSHTGGEPTRTIVSGGPSLRGSSVADQISDMQTRFDGYRRAIVNEPRGSEVMVGALLQPSPDDTHVCSVIFFNNIGYLGMCGHGMIGVVATLAHLGRIQPGIHRFLTVAGSVSATLHADGRATLENVPSYRAKTRVTLDVQGVGPLEADIAYGGNWFCLVSCPPGWDLERPIPELLGLALRILEACREQFPEVDHVEIFGKPSNTSQADSKSFVLCPGGMYDRSPCGTGTSAKLACLAADNKLNEGETWVQESIIGSTFEGRFAWQDQARGIIKPLITGRAFVNGDLQVLIDPADPFGWSLQR